MPKPNPHRPFTPDPEQMNLWPAVSGNEINGLGESKTRRPHHVYWAVDPDDIPHGDLQHWFYQVPIDDPEERQRRANLRGARQAVIDAPLPDVQGTPMERDPESWTEALNAFAEDGQCEMIGVAEMQENWLFEGYEKRWNRVIMLGVQHDYDALSDAPKETAGTEVIRQYLRAAAAAKQITGWLRTQGWDAEAVTGPMSGSLTLIPPALACGFGELGKHGSIINPEFGASFRLSGVMTNAPFAPTPPRDFGIDGFCQNCQICQDACPPEALFSEKQTVRGEEKWYVDFDKCLPFFNQHHGCAICIAVCPWSRPEVGMNLAAKLKRRAERLSTGMR